MAKIDRAVLKTLAYADVFDCPLTAESIERLLISPNRVSMARLEKSISRLNRNIEKKGRYYYLAGREKIVSSYQQRYQHSLNKQQISNKVARYLKIIPWIKAIVLTGTVAKDNAKAEDDIDWLIISTKNRLWLVRLLVLVFLQLIGRRRFPNKTEVTNKICLNMFLAENNLTLKPPERNLFSAHEILQSRLAWERGGGYRKFIQANAWAKNYLANLYEKKAADWVPDKEKTTENNLSFLIDLMEEWAYKLQLFYMKPRRTIEKIETSRALFHPQDAKEWILAGYYERLKNLGLMFDERPEKNIT